MKTILPLLFLAFSVSCCFSQVESDEDLSIYFDDKNSSRIRGIIKVNPLALIPGDLTIEFEQKISGGISIEGGVGYQLPYYVKEWGELWSYDEYIPKNVKSGFSWRVHPRFFYKRNGPEGFYTGPMYRERHYSMEGNKRIIFRDISVNTGYHYIPRKKFTVDVYYGIGFRFKTINYFSGNFWSNDVGLGRLNIVMPIGIKIGYVLY
jgi:hypothetical protein